MDAWDTMMSRRTAHEWVPGPVDDALIERALKAAHQAPCHKFTWPWRFVVVGPEAREALVPIAIACKERKRALSPAMRERLAAKTRGPGALIVACVKRCDNAFQAREDYAATACAIQNILLTVTDAGLHGKWSTGGVTTAAATYEVLGVDAEELEIIGFVWIGQGASLPTVVRPGLDDVVRRIP